MFQKKLLSFASALLILTFMTGCDFDVTVEPIVIPESNEVTSQDTEVGLLGEDDELTQDVTDEDKESEVTDIDSQNVNSNEDEKEPVSVPEDDGKDKRIYDEEEEFGLFLNDEAKCKIKAHEKGWQVDFEDENAEYSLSDLISNSENQSNNYDDLSVENVYYSYIDCGKDGNMELAVYFEYPAAEYQTEYYIFTLQDGQIYLSDIEYSYYVYYTDILDSGYVLYSGRSNAVTHFWGYGFVNADGDYIYDYEVYEQAAMSQPAIPADFLPSDYESYAEDFFDAEGEYMADMYNFTTFTYDYDDVSTFVDYYDEYKSHNMATFYDYDGNNVEPFDDMKKFYADNNIKWYTEDEIEALVAEHESEIGLTEDIKKGNPIQWTMLER